MGCEKCEELKRKSAKFQGKAAGQLRTSNVRYQDIANLLRYIKEKEVRPPETKLDDIGKGLRIKTRIAAKDER